MPVSLKTVLRLIVLCLAATAAVWTAVQAAGWVEARNRGAIQAVLETEGLGWVAVETDGLTVTLSGEAPDELTRFDALRLAATIVNSENLRDRMTVAAVGDFRGPDYRLELLRSRNDVTLLGLLPGGAAASDDLRDTLGEALPAAAVADLLVAAPGSAPDTWGAAQEAGLAALRELDTVRVVLTADVLEVTGLAPDSDTVTELETAIRGLLPDAVALDLDLRVPPPVLSPFLTRFNIDNGLARFDVCAASDAAGRDGLLAAAGLSGETAAGNCVIARGAPSPDWDIVAADAVAILTRLGAGTVTVADLTVTLRPGAHVSAEQVSDAIARLEGSLPDAFTLDVVASDLPPSDATDMDFTATRSPEGVTLVRGPVASEAARDMIGSFARARLAQPDLHVALRHHGDLPDDWTLRVLAALDAFAELEQGRLRVSPRLIALHGRTGDPQLSSRIAAGLTAALGPSEPFRLDIVYREALDPVASLPSPEECLARIADIQSRSKIIFEPGSTDLDADTLRIVRRIGTALEDCSDVQLIVAGHTDSQGRSEMNRDRSEARAGGVVSALSAEGVLPSSLTAIGLGEDQPVADNETEEGREANRRIEFRLRYPLQGPPPPDPDSQAASDSGAAQDASPEPEADDGSN